MLPKNIRLDHEGGPGRTAAGIAAATAFLDALPRTRSRTRSRSRDRDNKEVDNERQALS